MDARSNIVSDMVVEIMEAVIMLAHLEGEDMLAPEESSMLDGFVAALDKVDPNWVEYVDSYPVDLD